MCGLVGIIDKNVDVNQINMFRWMLHLDVVRGEDSTGVAVRSSKYNGKDGRVDLFKAVGHPSSLFRKYPEVFESNGKLDKSAFESSISFLMGHNRAKTIGATSETNAHPFHAQHIVGCHNGTLSGGLHQLPDNEEGETDSEQIFRALAEGWSIDKIVETAKGAMALTWWNAKEKSFNIYRNSERPLFIAHNASKTAYAYASEQWMLSVAAAKARQSAIFKEVKEIPAHTYMKFQIEPKVELVEEREITPKVFTIPQNNNHRGVSGGGNRQFKGITHSNVTSFDTGWVDVSFKDATEFDKHTKYGCSLCQDNLSFDEHKEGDIRWLDKETPLCALCAAEFKQEGAA